MSEHLKKRLKERGWHPKEIQKTSEILRRARRGRDHTHHLYALVAIGAIIVGNLLVSLILVPLMFGLSGPFLYFIVGILALKMGLLFEVLTRSVEHFEHEHHVLVGLLVPSLAFVTVILITVFSNSADFELGFRNEHNPYLISLTYALCFLLPYSYHRFFRKRNYYSG